MGAVKNVRRLINVVAFALLVASVIQELRKPSAERTWHGTIAGIFPYDLRPPTPGRLRSTFWNPENPRLLVPTAFGVGWSLNFGALAHPLRSG
jgi:hypothetical protein